jgi:hypothetical protein
MFFDSLKKYSRFIAAGDARLGRREGAASAAPQEIFRRTCRRKIDFGKIFAERRPKRELQCAEIPYDLIEVKT